ncbi:MAG: hypothetical protein N3B01_08010 [Verrucomicrobiae bacterium]|nr:hypothetical protein [Verrucomicrobiae bacterium]
MKTVGFGIVVIFAVGAGALAADVRAVELRGIFDPYECQDTSVTNRVVMKPAPKCRECHAWGAITGDRLELNVAHGKTTNSWTITGQFRNGQMVFEKPGFYMIYADGVLKGEYKGRMNARIELKAGDGPHSRPPR